MDEDLVVCGVEQSSGEGVNGRWAEWVSRRRSQAAWAAVADVVTAVGWRTGRQMRQALEDDAAWAVTAVAMTMPAAGVRCCDGVLPGWTAMHRRVEVLAVVLLAALLVGGSQRSFDSLHHRRHGLFLRPL